MWATRLEEAHVVPIYSSPKNLSSSRKNRLPEPRMPGCRLSMEWLVVLAGLLMPRRFLVITVIVWPGRVSSFVSCIISRVVAGFDIVR